MSHTDRPFPGYQVFVGSSDKYLVPTNFVAGVPIGWNRPQPNELNTIAQQCQNAEQLRQFPAFPAMVCFLQGVAEPADGLGGMFYWEAGDAFVDDNLDTIVPTIRPWPFGAGSEGAWLRAPFPGGDADVNIDADAPIVVTPDPITGSGTISHADSGVTANTYGDSTHVPQLTVDAKGHVTLVENVAISGGGGGGTDFEAGAGLTDTPGSSGGTITDGETLYNTRVFNNQTGTTYTLDQDDWAKIVTAANASEVDITVPDPATGGEFLEGWFCTIKNVGASNVRLLPAGSATFDGTFLLQLTTNQEVTLWSDGTEWRILRGATGGTGQDGAIVVGKRNQNQGTESVIVGGFLNSIDDGSTDAAILGGATNAITDGVQTVIAGGGSHIIQGVSNDSGVFAGQNHLITKSQQSAIIGGRNGVIGDGVTGHLYSVILGGIDQLLEGDYGAIIGGNNNTIDGIDIAAAIASNTGTISGGQTVAIIAGTHHTISGAAAVNTAVLGGATATATGGSSVIVGGQQASDDGNFGVETIAAGLSAQIDGSTLGGRYRVINGAIGAQTNSTSPKRLKNYDGDFLANAANTLSIPNNTVCALDITLVGRQGTTDSVVLVCHDALLVRGANAAATAIVGSPAFTVTFSSAGGAGTTATLAADTTLGSPNISVTPPNSSVWTWTAYVRKVMLGAP